MDACLIHDAARPERVMSDVVSIADLMRPSNYLAAKGVGAAAKEELLGGPGRGPTLLARQATCIFLTMRQTMTTTTTTCNMGPPAPATGSIPHTPNRTQPQSNPDHGTSLGLWLRGKGGGRDRQANKQPSDIYQQPPSSAGYIRAFARLSLLTALDVSGDMAQWD